MDSPQEVRLNCECPVCLCQYADGDHEPLMLTACGHNVCSSCCRKLEKPTTRIFSSLRSKIAIACPECRKTSSSTAPNRQLLFFSNLHGASSPVARQCLPAETGIKRRCCQCDGKYDIAALRACSTNDCPRSSDPICPSCFVSGHNGHSSVEYAEVHKELAEVEAKIRRKFEQAREYASTLETKVERSCCLVERLQKAVTEFKQKPLVVDAGTNLPVAKAFLEEFERVKRDLKDVVFGGGFESIHYALKKKTEETEAMLARMSKIGEAKENEKDVTMTAKRWSDRETSFDPPRRVAQVSFSSRPIHNVSEGNIRRNDLSRNNRFRRSLHK